MVPGAVAGVVGTCEVASLVDVPFVVTGAGSGVAVDVDTVAVGAAEVGVVEVGAVVVTGAATRTRTGITSEEPSL